VTDLSFIFVHTFLQSLTSLCSIRRSHKLCAGAEKTRLTLYVRGQQAQALAVKKEADHGGQGGKQSVFANKFVPTDV